MSWLTWRQYRAQAWCALALLAVVGALYGATGPRLAGLYDASGLPDCARTGTGCERAQAAFAAAVGADGLLTGLFHLGVVLLLVLPAGVGMFAGVPLVARDLESGAFRLTWTQGVSRTRWLLVRLALVGAAVAAVAGLLSLAVSWWAAPLDRAEALPGAGDAGLPGRFGPLVFAARGAVPVGWALFGFAAGVTAGLLLRRQVAATAVVLGVLAAAQVLVPLLVRPHLAAPVRSEGPLVLEAERGVIRIEGDRLYASTPVSLPGAWVLSVGSVDPAGRTFTGPVPQVCHPEAGTVGACREAIDALGLVQRVEYQPARRYWPFQWVETGALVLLSGAAAAGCAVRLRRGVAA
ncbi:transporter [Kitasatospora phosalacinea]|uniref:Transporter n=1 Tax=Kitasatospora phosalacinea TaxID=2065 RepID=A0A9W6V402_9ACTN|nr:transporter [Kitasatospora phosalacinea]GLW71762.1 transporter [Kitasatospora phosalacinea]